MKLRRDLENRDLGQKFSDEVAFERVVVDEDERIQTDIEFHRKLHQVRGLIFPVDAPSDEMRALQTARGMGVEHLEHVGLVVFAAERDEHAALQEVQHGGVKGGEHLAGIFRRIELDPLHPVFADDTAPQGVVAIEDQALLGSSLESAPDARELPGVSVKKRTPERRAPEIPAAVVDRRIDAEQADVAVPIKQAEPRRVLPGEVDHERVQRRDLRTQICLARINDQPRLGVDGRTNV